VRQRLAAYVHFADEGRDRVVAVGGNHGVHIHQGEQQLEDQHQKGDVADLTGCGHRDDAGGTEPDLIVQGASEREEGAGSTIAHTVRVSAVDVADGHDVEHQSDASFAHRHAQVLADQRV